MTAYSGLRLVASASALLLRPVPRADSGNAAGASFHRGKRILRPVAGKDGMLQRVIYCCRGFSGTVCPIGGRDDGRAAWANQVSTDVTATRIAKSAASTATPLSARCEKFTARVLRPGIRKPRN